MNVRVLVADEAEVEFFTSLRPNLPLLSLGMLRDDQARLRNQDLESDREGRGFGGFGRRHGLDGERSAERERAMRFARTVARQVDHERACRAFDRLVIIAGPRMLGLLRQELTSRCQALLVAQVSKDLVHSDEETIRQAIPRTAYWN